MLPERITRKIEFTDSCWLWNGALSNGYGKVWWEGAIVYAHRLFYELHKGRIPEEMTIDHLCRVRRCVNPEHLEAVTMHENWRRGESASAQSLRATHCSRGHALEGDNVIPRQNGWRICRACRDMRNAARSSRSVAA